MIDCKFVGQKVIFIQMDRIDRKESSGSGLRVGNEELVVRDVYGRKLRLEYAGTRKI